MYREKGKSQNNPEEYDGMGGDVAASFRKEWKWWLQTEYTGGGLVAAPHSLEEKQGFSITGRITQYTFWLIVVWW